MRPQTNLLLARPNVRVSVGSRDRMDEGEIEVDAIQRLGLPDITSAMAQASGFLGMLDLLKVAKHGNGEQIFLIHFHYIPPSRTSLRARAKKASD
jgi:hypothetical protein